MLGTLPRRSVCEAVELLGHSHVLLETFCIRSVVVGAQPSQHAVLMKHFEPLVPRTSAPQPTAAACAVALLSACRRHMAPQASAFAAADAIDRQRSVTARGLMESN